MDNMFVRTPFVPKDYRTAARLALKNVWGLAIAVTLIYGFLAGGGFRFDVNINFSDTDLDTLSPETMEQIRQIVLNPAFLTAMAFGSTLSVVSLVIGGPIQVGYSRFCLKIADGRPVEFKELFSGFDVFGEAFLLRLRIALRIIGWSLLLIVPGIIAAFRYSQAFYIMAENPGMKSGECIEASKQMMDGHKGDLFLLGLSFIGWFFVCLLTCGIGFLWLQPYVYISEAIFYRDVSGTKAETSRLYSTPTPPYGTAYYDPNTGRTYTAPNMGQQAYPQPPQQNPGDPWHGR